jgi:hypothetical protein
MTTLEDRQAIADIIARERAARDAADWTELARCYTANSLVDLSWFRGTGAKFAEASAGMATTMFSFHELGPTVIDLHGDRALGDTGCTIHLIGELDGVEVDVLGYNRLRARVQREDDEWRMAGLRSIYIHDLIVPLNPSTPPRVARKDLENYRRSYRRLCHMLVNHGLPARDDLPGVDKPETVAALVAAEKAWLHDGPPA